MAGTQGEFVQPDPNSNPFPISGTAAPGPVDEAAFTEGASRFTPVGGEFKDAGVNLADGQAGCLRLTQARGAHVTLYDPTGLERGQNTQPMFSTIVAGKIPTYGFVTIIAPGANPTDILTIKGSATKLIRIHRITISGVQTAAAVMEIDFVRRSTADTLGTPVGVAGQPLSTADAAATAVVTGYTAAPTLGTLVGFIRGGFYLVGTAATGGLILEWTWKEPGQRQPILSGILDFFCINMAGAAFVGGNLEITVELSEE